MTTAKLSLPPETHQIAMLRELSDMLEQYRQAANYVGIRETARLILPLLVIVDGNKAIPLPKLVAKRIELKKDIDWQKEELEKTVAIKAEFESAQASIARINQIRPDDSHALLLENIKIALGRTVTGAHGCQQWLDNFQQEEKINDQRLRQMTMTAVELATGRKTLDDFEILGVIRQRRDPAITQNSAGRLAAD